MPSNHKNVLLCRRQRDLRTNLASILMLLACFGVLLASLLGFLGRLGRRFYFCAALLFLLLRPSWVRFFSSERSVRVPMVENRLQELAAGCLRTLKTMLPCKQGHDSQVFVEHRLGIDFGAMCV